MVSKSFSTISSASHRHEYVVVAELLGYVRFLVALECAVSYAKDGE